MDRFLTSVKSLNSISLLFSAEERCRDKRGRRGGRHDVQSKLGLVRVDHKCYCCWVCERHT